MVKSRIATSSRVAAHAAAVTPGATGQQPVPGAAGPIQIEAIIQHELDNRAARPVLAQEPGLLTPEAHTLFASYIAATAARADWSGHFVDPGDGCAQLCGALLGDQRSFVDASRGLAERLYAAMRPRSIAPGDFATLIYTAGADPQRHVALLKLDPQSRQARSFQRINGRLRPVYGRADNLLPEERHLQKCALLTTSATGTDFDVTLLDTQAGPVASGVAAFFYNTFLGVRLAPSSRRLTRRFVELCETWLEMHRERLSPAELFAFYAARREALRSSSVVVASFAGAALGAHADLRRALAEHLASNLVEGNPARIERFAVDISVVASLLRTVTLELDGGARLRVRADRLETLLDLARLRRTGNRYELVIASLTLREVSD
ncbi:MAG: nucleoid-associated protein [Ktedonobacterales bacterium]